MELQHSFTVPVPADEAWEAFNDLERIAPCFPGAQITTVEGDDFTGTAKVKLGPIALQYNGSGRWLERDNSAYRAVIEASGKDRRGNGTASATITARLEEAPDGTRVVVDTDLKITGRPAQFGRGVIQDVGNKLLDQFAECLSTRLGAGEQVTVPSELPGEQAADQAAAVQEQEAVAAQSPVAAASSTTAPSSTAASTAARAPEPAAELDLGPVLGLALARRYAPLVLTALLTAAITWWLARRGR